MLLGIDIGTSSVKAMLMKEDGRIIAVRICGYDVDVVKPGWGEQKPQLWWESLCRILQEMSADNQKEFTEIKGVGFSGQMHGLVAVDENGVPVRPAILWMDQRATAQLEQISQTFTKEQQGIIFHNRVFNGFALPSLLWVKENEPEIYRRIAKIFHPKDYLRFCLTGKIGTELSDASAGLLVDPGKKSWAKEALGQLGISERLLPDLGASDEIAGTVTAEAAQATGIPAGIPVVYGAGDQQAQSIGNGAVREGLLIANIGTGAQISCYSKTDRYDPQLRTHTFCHAVPDGYTIYGAMLSGGLSLKWLKNQILGAESFDKLSEMAETVVPGSEELIFLPYLSGERTPLMNPEARGVFFGLSLNHTAAHMARAVMEGVTYALRDSMEIMQDMGIESTRILASGGAAASGVWLQILADILGKEVQVCKTKEQACLGACILAGVGCGVYESISAACEMLVEYEDRIYMPRTEYKEVYENSYRKFHGLYESTKQFL